MTLDIHIYAPLPSPAEMTEWDSCSIEQFSIRNEMLMENACREALAVLTDEIGEVRGKRILLLAGGGNNGGDAICLGRHLLDQGALPLVLLKRPKKKYTGVSGYHLRVAQRVGVQFAPLKKNLPGDFHPDVIVDGLLGTGFQGELRQDFQHLVSQINAASPHTFIFALDIPSGLSGETGLPLPVAVKAHATVTFEAAKLGLALPGAREYTGRLHVRPIGIPLKVKEQLPPRVSLLTNRIRALLPAPTPTMHKGAAGKVLIIGGAEGLTGAPMLAALGALRAGAGLISVACPAPLAAELKAGFPDIMTIPFLYDNAKKLAPHVEASDAVVIGPGLGRSAEAAELLKEILQFPCAARVIDADALYWLSVDNALLGMLHSTDVLTPHPGEMGRLIGEKTKKCSQNTQFRLDATAAFAHNNRLTIVHKGAGTVLAGAAGELALSPFSAPNLAVGGAGDVLSGVIGALLARGLPPFDAAALGVYWHGLCGENLAARYPLRGNTAREIADALPRAWEDKQC